MLEKALNTSFLRTVAIIFILAGATGSLYFMFNASRNQNSVLLIVLFTAWVLSPFVGFFIIENFFNRRTTAARIFLYILVIILAIGSLVAYSGAFNTPDTKNAFVFLIVPLMSWLLLIITVVITRILLRKTSDNH